jgi:hypothetical protein
MKPAAFSRWLAIFACLCILGARTPIRTIAGTTGGITGGVHDSRSQAPLASVNVTASSASQVATTTTDSSGSFRFLSLAPDTYTLEFTKDGYDVFSEAGITVFADQVQSLSVGMVQTLKTIARVTSTSAGTLVKSGTASDVYSVSGAVASAASGLTGPGSLSNAYGAIASVPGVSMDPSQAGWWQMVHIRGGDIDQVGYELDGIPVNRVYDNAPMTMLSSLGQQELQVYTGGTPASADAQGISGYVNQVVKTGTYPGFGTATLTAGSPAFYHGASVEAGGSTPDRLFTWYVGLGGANQDYRYVDNYNGASDLNWFFYPVNAVDPSSFCPDPNCNIPVYMGTNGTNPNALYSSGLGYSIIATQQRDTIANFHFAIPHKHGGLRDDVQAMYLTSEVWAQYFSSQNDFGPSVVNQLGQNSWDDSYVYTGPLGQAPNSSSVVPYYFPYSPAHSFGAALPASIRDDNDNGVAVTKLQYQHAFSNRAFLRVYGYTLYSNWFIWGPNTAAQPYYGAELAEYQIPDHTYGANLNFTDQLTDKNLMTVSYGYTGSNLQRYDIGYIRPHYNVANYIGSDGNCYDPASGSQVGCVYQEQQDTGDIQAVMNGTLPAATYACPGSPACSVSPQWTVTNNTFYSGSGQALNQVHTRFSGFSWGDEWRPNDAWDVNIGTRIENFRYIYGPTGADDPTRRFWFAHYNDEYCTAGIGTAPQLRTDNGVGPCPAGAAIPLAGSRFALTNPGSVPDYVVARFEPRFSFTYTVNPDTVIRGSAGLYARPPNSSWVQYNVVQEDLPVYLGNHFAAFGFTTPEHTIRPDTSYNYDLSLEKHLRGTDLSFKLTPFYRATRDQLQNFFIDPAGGLESGLNVGNQVSQGVEFAISKGDFNRNGWAAQLSYTYTHSAIRYKNFPGQSINIIDQLNNYIQQYNSFTSKCAADENAPLCGNGVYASNGSAVFANASGSGPAIPNPYYNKAPQPLLDRNAWYPTYDVVPGPFAGLNGYWVPHVVSLLLNYRHDRFAITPALQWSSGAEYGAPTVWPGYNPNPATGGGCSATLASGLVDPLSCDSGYVFLPDPYNHGRFDTLGQFKQPWVLTGSLGLSYDFSSRIRARLTAVNLLDVCHQRGYPWDQSQICTYGALGASIMAAEGNFYPNSVAAAAPVQMKYPYGFFLNNTNTGFLGATQPIQLTGSLEFKL